MSKLEYQRINGQQVGFRWISMNQFLERRMDEILRYTDLAHTIQLARAAGLSTREIVRALSGSLPHGEARELAKRAAPLLGLTTQEFLSLRKNN